MLSIIYDECHSQVLNYECQYAECPYNECHYAQYRSHYDEDHFC
jgi:hypothetical protein